MYLKRKIDQYLQEWKAGENRKPLIVKGARQIGKTESIREFAKANYSSFIEINFVEEPKYKTIIEEGYAAVDIIKNISRIDPDKKFIPQDTLILFDELQEFPEIATSLKFFCQDGRFDVICSGSLLGISYQRIESNSVGYKNDYLMYSMDFEEFLWAKDYKEEQIEDLYKCMLDLKPLSTLQYNVMMSNFKDYMIVGGMPAIVKQFVTNKNFSGILKMQQQILIDYEEDITKYAGGLDKTKILNCYRKIPVFLGNENKKFQISKIADGARNREYVGIIEWLSNAGIVNVSYSMEQASLPLKGNYNPDNYRLYFADTGLLIGSLDEEVQEDLRNNENMNTYKGALYENIVGDMLVKAGYDLYFYKDDSKKIEMDFMIRDINSLIPVEVKANDNATISLNNLINGDKYKDIKYGIKLCNKNIGFNGKFYTFPYFLTFLLKRYLKEK